MEEDHTCHFLTRDAWLKSPLRFHPLSLFACYPSQRNPCSVLVPSPAHARIGLARKIKSHPHKQSYFHAGNLIVLDIRDPMPRIYTVLVHSRTCLACTKEPGMLVQWFPILNPRNFQHRGSRVNRYLDISLSPFGPIHGWLISCDFSLLHV